MRNLHMVVIEIYSHTSREFQFKTRYSIVIVSIGHFLRLYKQRAHRVAAGGWMGPLSIRPSIHPLTRNPDASKKAHCSENNQRRRAKANGAT